MAGFMSRASVGQAAGSGQSFDQHIQHAYDLLCSANRKGIQVPTDVIETITQARHTMRAGKLEGEIETKFWNAYGLLSSSIEPAERARRFYKGVFYAVLAVLLSAQFYYLAGASVRDKLTDLDKEEVEVSGRVSVMPTSASPGMKEEAEQSAKAKRAQIESKRRAYLNLSRMLLNLPGTVLGFPFKMMGLGDSFWHGLTEAGEAGPDSGVRDTVVRAKLEMLLVFLAGYLLPTVYGLLGACAFVLRKLSDEIDKLTFAHDARVRYTLRLNIGLLSGLAVGWFIRPVPGDPTLATLSPLALAFVAGYGSDLLFAALDKIVSAFAPQRGSSSSTITQTTTGGITTVVERRQEAHVAGGDDTPGPKPAADAATRPADATEPRRTDPEPVATKPAPVAANQPETPDMAIRGRASSPSR